MKHLFLVNPTAGPYDRSHELTVKLSDQLDGLGLDWEVQVTPYPGHGAALARAAREMGLNVRCGTIRRFEDILAQGDAAHLALLAETDILEEPGRLVRARESRAVGETLLAE